MNELQPIDELIRRRIEALPPQPARGWEQLADRLDADGADQAVAAKLAGLTPSAPVGSWEALANKLDEVEAANLDEVVASGLQSAEPATVSGWSQLAARLELISRRREMVACLKITEGALLLSLLLLFARFGHVLQGPASNAVATGPTEQPRPEVTDASIRADQITADHVEAPGLSPQPTVREIVSSAVDPLPASSPIDCLSSVHAASIPLRLIVQDVDALAHRISPVPEKELEVHLPLRLSGLFSDEPVHYYLNAFISPLDLNMIVTQENPLLSIDAQRKISTGYSAGALIEAEQGRNALQFGLIYGHRSYVPAEILLIDEESPGIPESLDIRFSRLAYETVSIPLNYQRILSNEGPWRISAGVGMAMNVVLQSDVRLPDDVSLEDLNNLIENTVAKAPVFEKSMANEILDPTRGYFQGGGVLENSSLYLSGNLRIERLLNDRWSLYFSPTVGKLVTIREGDGGRGPLEDRIHNTMLRMGARMRLSDR